jgi:hypothetical protein
MSTSKVSVGIPLRQTSPPAVEKYLIDKVREDLGEYKDLATITPALRVDSEDGDLSGNITNGFGNLMLDVRGTKVHIPFMIHQKELIPFDVIRMGEQEVPYSVAALRKVINGVYKHNRDKENEGDESGGFSIGTVVDRKDTPLGNGFLGTIMQMRDGELNRTSNGNIPFSGPDFGSMDDSRFERYASEKVDVLEVFQDVVEKLASVKSIPRAEVMAFIKDVEKKAADESQAAIDAVSKVEATDSLEAAGIRRGMSKLQDDKLADSSRCASGNNIKFPIADQGRFEYRYGRVYHNIEEWAKNDKERVLSPLKSVVVDSRLGYKLLKSTDKFMVTLDQPPIFDFKMERARGLEQGHMYAMEINETTISYPFEVENTDQNGLVAHGTFYDEGRRKDNSLFTLALSCKEAMPSKEKEYNYTTHRSFSILIPRDETIKEIKHITHQELEDMIQTQAKDPVDARLANQMSCSYCKDYYIIPRDHLFYKLEKSIEGFFTKPDGYFKEGPLVKHAAYDDMNSCTLKVEQDRQPRRYGIEFHFNTPEDDGQGTAAVQTQKREFTAMSEEQARKVLLDLGFDNRQTEILFEYCRRNGRQATLALPDPEKARNVAPNDMGAEKANSAMKNILQATFSADNFLPVLGDVMSSSMAGVIGNVAPQTSDWARSLGDWFKTSYEVAVELEKIATETRGSHWHEVAALVNLKHRMDKFACDIANGSFVSGLNEPFEKIASLMPNISEHAKNLIDFNRQQIVTYERPIVSPTLIKQALHELNGLYRYAMVHQAPVVEKTAGVMENAKKYMSTLVGKTPTPQSVGFIGEASDPEFQVVKDKAKQATKDARIGAAVGAGSLAAIGIGAASLNKRMNKNQEKTAADEGPHRSSVNFMGEHVVGRPSAALLDLLPGHKTVNDVIDTITTDANDMMARLAATAEASGLGK